MKAAWIWQTMRFSSLRLSPRIAGCSVSDTGRRSTSVFDRTAPAPASRALPTRSFRPSYM